MWVDGWVRWGKVNACDEVYTDMGQPQELSTLADLGLLTPSSNYCRMFLTLQAWLAPILPPNSAVISYTVHGALDSYLRASVY